MMKRRAKHLDQGPLIWVSVISFAAILLTACLGGRNSLARTTWSLSSMGGSEPLLGTAITLEFAKDTLLGSAGCNTYSGTYTAQDGAILISKTSSTQILCTRDDDTLFQGLMDQEERYLQILELSVSYELISDSGLVMYDDAGHALLIFERQTVASLPVVDEVPAETPSPQIREQLAPIERIEIQPATSSPSQYMLRVISGLPNLCTQYDRFQVLRDGDTIRISIVNIERFDASCDQTYATVEQSIPLGSNFEPGQTYTVQVNDVVETFVARARLVPPPAETESPASPTPELSATTPPAVETLVTATPESAPTMATGTPLCSRPEGWTEHVVARGENLFRIALESGTTFEQLAIINCLENSRRIAVGQTLFVPVPPLGESQPTATASTSKHFYLILPGDEGRSGLEVGCGDSAVSVDSRQPLTGSLIADIEASLSALFSANPVDFDVLDYVNALSEAAIEVQNVNLLDDTIWVHLTGSMPLAGICADARIRSQILLTVFQYTGFDSAMISFNGQNLKRIFDYSGTVTVDEPFLRSEIN